MNYSASARRIRGTLSSHVLPMSSSYSSYLETFFLSSVAFGTLPFNEQQKHSPSGVQEVLGIENFTDKNTGNFLL